MILKRRLEKYLVIFTCVVIATVFAAISATSQTSEKNQTEVLRIRGAIESVEPSLLVLKSRSGEILRIELPEELNTKEVFPIGFEELQTGSIVGSTGMKRNDGIFDALEVHMFPIEWGGPPNGQRVSNLAPGSILTNGQLVAAETMEKGRRMKLTCNGEDISVFLTDDVPIVTYRQGDRNLLMSGAKVYLHAVQVGEHLKAVSATVGADGTTPPM